MIIIGIESSCDETSVAVTEEKNGSFLIRSNVIATQIPEHRLYGGVVPEIASRRHCENISKVCGEACDAAGITPRDADIIAVTYAPGLIGALLVGVNFAKGLAYACNKPLVPVHHIHGHIAACYLACPELRPPFLCLAVSGGHSHIIEVKDYVKFRTAGRTIDDAAGEAFDKAARVLGLPYPGGREIEAAAKKCDLNAALAKYKLPFPHTAGEFDYSFSGMKTAVINIVHNLKQKGAELTENDVSEIAAAFQHTAAAYLSAKFLRAARKLGYKNLCVTGGVAANMYVRNTILTEAYDTGADVRFPPAALCGDNAAMIACQGYFEYVNGRTADMSLNAHATFTVDNYL